MKYLIAFINIFILSCTITDVFSNDAAYETVSKHGQLSVNGIHLVDQYGQNVQLKGMSLFWDVWMPQYYNDVSIDGVHVACHGNVVRAAMAVATDSNEGYIFDPYTAMSHVKTVIEAAIRDDIYVIVDWHDSNAEAHLDQAIQFFDEISRTYGQYPNVIYETFNEPEGQSWSDVLKPYHETIIRTIRANDPDNIIICGTPNWSQQVDQAAADPISDQINIMYTLHFYAATHKQWLRDLAQNAMNMGIPIFITEYGTVNADASEPVDEDESRLWWSWLDANSLSYVNWAISDKVEGASALVSGTPPDRVCDPSYLTQSGRLVVAQNMA